MPASRSRQRKRTTMSCVGDPTNCFERSIASRESRIKVSDFFYDCVDFLIRRSGSLAARRVAATSAAKSVLGSPFPRLRARRRIIALVASGALAPAHLPELRLACGTAESARTICRPSRQPTRVEQTQPPGSLRAGQSRGTAQTANQTGTSSITVGHRCLSALARCRDVGAPISLRLWHARCSATRCLSGIAGRKRRSIQCASRS